MELFDSLDELTRQYGITAVVSYLAEVCACQGILNAEAQDAEQELRWDETADGLDSVHRRIKSGMVYRDRDREVV